MNQSDLEILKFLGKVLAVLAAIFGFGAAGTEAYNQYQKKVSDSSVASNFSQAATSFAEMADEMKKPPTPTPQAQTVHGNYASPVAIVNITPAQPTTIHIHQTVIIHQNVTAYRSGPIRSFFRNRR